LIEENATDEEREKGFDLADYLLRFSPSDFTQQQSESVTAEIQTDKQPTTENTEFPINLVAVSMVLTNSSSLESTGTTNCEDINPETQKPQPPLILTDYDSIKLKMKSKKQTKQEKILDDVTAIMLGNPLFKDDKQGDTLDNAVYSFGQLCGSGVISEIEAEHLLNQTIKNKNPESDLKEIFRAGFEKGKKESKKMKPSNRKCELTPYFTQKLLDCLDVDGFKKTLRRIFEDVQIGRILGCLNSSQKNLK